jgi:hypothetical protein
VLRRVLGREKERLTESCRKSRKEKLPNMFLNVAESGTACPVVEYDLGSSLCVACCGRN